MNLIRINVVKHSNEYEIIVGTNLLSAIGSLINLAEYTKVFLLTDSNVAQFHLDKIFDALVHPNISSYIVAAGENSKSLDTFGEVQTVLCNLDMDRKGLIINIGGGVVSDLGGFVAATYRRGVDFINISTTLEGMVDASIGGKNGVNLNKYKNYVGVFAQPKAVILDIDTLSTLDTRAFVAGWAEVIKHGLIADPAYYDYVTSKHPLDFTKKELTEIVTRSCEIKKQIVENDETETGIRKSLNFGHTIGHAVESISYSYDMLLHGEAVAIGMVAEAYMSHKLNYLSMEEHQSLERRMTFCGLPVKIPFRLGNADEIMTFIKRDKKNYDDTIMWSLITSIGTCTYDERVDAEILKQALEHIMA